jgi:hypothetical protein
MANVVFAAAIWNWKKWGAYGLGVSLDLLHNNGHGSI